MNHKVYPSHITPCRSTYRTSHNPNGMTMAPHDPGHPSCDAWLGHR